MVRIFLKSDGILALGDRSPELWFLTVQEILISSAPGPTTYNLHAMV